MDARLAIPFTDRLSFEQAATVGVGTEVRDIYSQLYATKKFIC